MGHSWVGLPVCLLASFVIAGSLFAGTEDPRNPFGVPDVPNPEGPDVQALARTVTLKGDQADANAASWVEQATEGKRGSLDGPWHERWNHQSQGNWQYGKGLTRIQTVGDRVYFLVESSNGQFLIDTRRNKNRLVGRYRGIDHPSDTGPCVFVIVDDERIDGSWAGHGRWDFRRRLQTQ